MADSKTKVAEKDIDTCSSLSTSSSTSTIQDNSFNLIRAESEKRHVNKERPNNVQNTEGKKLRLYYFLYILFGFMNNFISNIKILFLTDLILLHI